MNLKNANNILSAHHSPKRNIENSISVESEVCGDGKSLVCYLEHGQRTKLGAFALWDRQWREPYCFKFLDMLDTQYYTIKHLNVDSMDLLWMRSDSGVPHFKITPPTMSHLIGEWVKKRFYYDFS